MILQLKYIKQTHNDLNILRWNLINFLKIMKVYESWRATYWFGFEWVFTRMETYHVLESFQISDTLCYHIFLCNLNFQLFTCTKRAFPTLIVLFFKSLLGSVTRCSTNKIQLYFVFSWLQNLEAINYRFYLQLILLH